MTDELDVYLHRIGDLSTREYLFLFTAGFLPHQEKSPTDRAVSTTREVFERVEPLLCMEASYDPNVKVDPLTMRTIIEYVAQDLLGPLTTPDIVHERYLLEPALILGGHRIGETITYDELSARVHHELDPEALDALGR